MNDFDKKLEEYLLKEHLDLASQFYFEGSTEEKERNDYGPKHAKEMAKAIKSLFAEMMREQVKNYHYEDWGDVQDGAEGLAHDIISALGEDDNE